MVPNSYHTTFLKVAAWSLIVTAFTTLVAHLVSFPTPTFEDSIQLYLNQGYILRNSVIIFHCVLVIVSMIGLGLLEFKNNPGWIGLGFVCFTVFGIAEITRMTFANVVVNGLRQSYAEMSADVTRDTIRYFLEVTWPLIGTTLFLIFIVAFSLGCIFYGVAFLKVKWVGWIFLFWGIINLLAFANYFWGFDWLNKPIEIFSFTYQPLARLAVGIWFLKFIRDQ